MVKSGPPSPLRTEDYEAIQDAVMETERGRWFLREFAQRNRNADTDVLLSAIQKLHNNLVTTQQAPDAQRITLDLADMANAIAETKKQIAAMGSEGGEEDKVTIASNELDAIVRTAEKATGDILNTAELVQEMAWNLREQGVDAESCDTLDQYATDIYTACSFQDLTGQRTEKVIKVLQFIENRVLAMMDIWEIDDPEDEHQIETFKGLDSRPDAHLLNGPQLEDNATSQGDIDDMMSDDMFDNPAADPAMNNDGLASLDNKEDDVEALIDDIEFDVSEPEILEAVDVPCNPSQPKGPCVPAYVLDDDFGKIPKPNQTAEPNVATTTAPNFATSPDDEVVEIGTSDEFAEVSSEQENPVYTPDGQPETEASAETKAPELMDNHVEDFVPQANDMLHATGGTTPPPAMEISSPEPAFNSQMDSSVDTFSAPARDHLDTASLTDPPLQQAPYTDAPSGGLENQTGDDAETSLSALTPHERQIIFS